MLIEWLCLNCHTTEISAVLLSCFHLITIYQCENDKKNEIMKLLVDVCVFLQDPECLDMDNERWQDINVVSSLLKLFLRKLPDPLITDGKRDCAVAMDSLSAYNN